MAAMIAVAYQSERPMNSLKIVVPQWTIEIVQFINISCSIWLPTVVIYLPVVGKKLLPDIAGLVTKKTWRFCLFCYFCYWSKFISPFEKPCCLHGKLWPDNGMVFVKSMEHWVIFCNELVLLLVLECSIFTTAEIFHVQSRALCLFKVAFILTKM